MTELALYREPTVLEAANHRHLKLLPMADLSVTERMHASYLAAVEFAQAAREFVIVFVRRADAAGKPEVSSVVLLGVTPGENLFVNGSQWDASYIPAYIRRYPFWTILLESSSTSALMFDAWWRGFSQTVGEALFVAEGRPAPMLVETLQFVCNFETGSVRTQAFCARLVELDLLRAMRADLTLPDGSTLTLNDFLTIDEDKLQALSDATVIEAHRNGMLGLIHAHLLSLANIRPLVERKVRRKPAAAA